MKWFEGPEGLLNEEEWSEQSELKGGPKSLEEQRPIKKAILYTQVKNEVDEWDDLLKRKPYWSALRTAAWSLRFMESCWKKFKKGNVIKGPLTTEEVMRARVAVKRAQSNIMEMKETPSCKLIRDESSGTGCPKKQTTLHKPCSTLNPDILTKYV